MRTAKIGPDLSWLLSLLRFVLSLCEQSEAVPPGVFNFLVSVEELLSDNEWILANSKLIIGTANGFWRLRISFSDSEYIFATANEF